MDPSFIPVIIIAFILLAVALGVFAYQVEKKRKEALLQLATTVGLHFAPGRNKGLIRDLSFIEFLKRGNNRYAKNVLSGTINGHPVKAFEYHFSETSGSGKNRSTRHYTWTVFVLTLPKPFPELRVFPESFFRKLAGVFGYSSIDFESAEFNRKYAVRSPDKRFAYDFCNTSMIELLLDSRPINLEVDRDRIAFVLERRLPPGEYEECLDLLLRLREKMPAYLFVNA